MKKEKQLINELLFLARDAIGVASFITTAAQYLNGGCEDVDDDVFDRIWSARKHAVNLLDGIQCILKEYGRDET